MLTPRRQFRFLFEVDGLNVAQYVSEVYYSSSSTFETSFMEFEEQPIFPVLLDWMRSRVAKTGYLSILDGQGTQIQNTIFHGLSVLSVAFEKLDYNSSDPIRIKAVLMYQNVTRDIVPSAIANSLIKTTSKCQCGGKKTNTTHSSWCPEYA